MLSAKIRERLGGFETPFYLYDLELLRRTAQSALREAGRYGYSLHFAVKANHDRRVMELLASLGMGADCVSGNEIRRAVETGFSPGEIVYAGVGKRDGEIAYALQQGIFLFNCESMNELEVIDSIAEETGTTANVALRLNPNVDPRTHRYITTGLSDNKFGIPEHEIPVIIGMIGSLRRVNVTGLHFHIGSQITDMKVFKTLCGVVNSSYSRFVEAGLDITDVNVGGGLGVDYDDPDGNPVPDFEAYFSAFAQTLSLPASVRVHFEPGRSLVAQCGELLSRVLYTKTGGSGEHIALIDASMTELIRPALYGSGHAIENLERSEPGELWTIGGTACESSDIFAKCRPLPRLRRGDMVSIKSAGAYGAVMSSHYNLHDLPPSVFSDDPAFG